MQTKYFCILAISLFGSAHLIFSQSPAIDWQVAMGGSGGDYGYDISPTADGGAIVGCLTTSGISGNKTDAGYGLGDYWIFKLNAAGAVEWQKTYGGSGSDNFARVIQTADGGYLLGGSSGSPISGVKTEGLIGGSFDYWIIKTDATGNIVWQNTIGGTGADNLTDLANTADGGYIVCGYSLSPISGDKTENSATTDYWILKLNATGNITWQNTIGGTGSDYAYTVGQTPDGGYIVSGYSTSNATGDKTENLVGAFGADDIWEIKLDAAGNIVWQNDIGGTSSDAVFESYITASGGVLLSGWSDSSASGDKTEPSIGAGVNSADYWVMELDASGNIVWQNTIGTVLDDFSHGIIQTNDGGVAVVGYSSSGINTDKTEASMGGYDYWLLQLDASGNIVWQNTIGGSGTEYAYGLAKTTDGSLIMVGQSSSGISGDKTIANYGSYDCWVVKMDLPCTPVTEICNSLDDDCDGIVDDGIVETISISAGGATTVCQGTPVVLTATYSGATVQWKKNAVNISGATNATYSATATGNYTCVTSSACGTATSSTIAVTVNKNPSASIAAGGPTSFCAGGSVTLTETPVGGSTYQWYKGVAAIAGATTNVYVATMAGNYKCRVTKTATGCFKNSNSIAIFITCREGEIPNSETVSVYPNPAHDRIIVETQLSGTKEVIIMNMTGLIVLKTVMTDPSMQLDISPLPAGIFTIQISDQYTTAQRKFIIE